MKKISFLFISFFFVYGGFAQGIKFEHSTWSEVLTKAKKLNKPIFVDVYTTWCGPCKMLAKSVFTDSLVGKFYNEHFVCYKIDAEKNDGPKFKLKYTVSCYPTILFINANEEVEHRFSNFVEAPEFINRAKTALDQENNLKGLSKKYTAGKRDVEFIKKYLNVLNQAYLNPVEVANEYFKQVSPKELLVNKNYQFLYDNLKSVNNPVFNYLKAHFPEIENEFGKWEAIDLLNNIFTCSIEEALKNGDENAYSKIFSMLNATKYDKQEETISKIKMETFYFRKDWKNYLKSGELYLNTYLAGSWVDNWKFSKSILDANILNIENAKEIALKFALKAEQLTSNYSTLINLAEVYFKMGHKINKQKIIAAIEKSIEYELSHKTNRDLSKEKKFLEEVKKW
ncbi:MAG: thioredoxin [Bacteroidales bacterium]|nr:MAG: thioredoxin [Bacteroidales bacterium]